jgi:hypothetical protein
MPLSLPPLIHPAQDNAQGQENGPRTGISADVVGKAAPKNEEDIVIPETVAEVIGAVAVWI